MTGYLVDDHLLLRVLLDDTPPEIVSVESSIYTTGLWFHRLGRALRAGPVAGALSRRLDAVPAVADAVVAALTTLPDDIGLLSLRELAWPMARIANDGVRLNLLSLEALAAAEHLDAVICLATEDTNPPLIDAAERRGVGVRLVDG